MAKEIQYKDGKIKSHPNKLKETPEFSPSGIIQYSVNGEIREATVGKLNIPDDEWICHSEAEADEVFVRHAKVWIDNNL